MDTHITDAEHPTTTSADERTVSLDRRLAVLFWPLLLILIGTLWLFPQQQLPRGTWLLGIGVILLSLNGVRFLNSIPVRMGPTWLGFVALAAGLAEYAGVQLPLLSLTFIAIGSSIIFELLAARKA